MKQSMSIAVLALLGTSAAHRHHHHHKHPRHKYNVQFLDEYDEDNDAITKQSIAESEKEHGAKMAVLDEDHYKQAIRMDNKLKFNGDDFQKNERVDNSLHRNLLLGTGFLNMEIP